MVGNTVVVRLESNGLESRDAAGIEVEGGETVERGTKAELFTSFEDENAAEHRRLAAMSPQERWRELAVLQTRFWGEEWGSAPIAKRASWERLSW